MLIARTLARGELIREPGCWDIPIEVYHQQCADGPSVSKTGLWKIFDKSPAHFFATSVMNPNAVEEKRSKALDAGKLAHHELLGQSNFDAEFAVLPEKWSDFKKADAREWRAYQESLGKTAILPSDLKLVEGMRESLSADPLVRAGILNGDVERSLVWRDSVTGIWIKSRPDAIPADSDVVADLKTTQSVSRDEIEKSIGKYGYHVQAAITGAAFKHVLNRKMEAFALVLVESAPPHCVKVVELKQEDIALGAAIAKKALMLMRHCLDTGRWPGPGGYSSDAEFVEIKPWARTQAENRIAAIELELEMAS